MRIRCIYYDILECYGQLGDDNIAAADFGGGGEERRFNETNCLEFNRITTYGNNMNNGDLRKEIVSELKRFKWNFWSFEPDTLFNGRMNHAS